MVTANVVATTIITLHLNNNNKIIKYFMKKLPCIITCKFPPCSQTFHADTSDHYSYRKQSVVTTVQPYLTSVFCLFLFNSFSLFSLFSAMDTQSNFSALQKKYQKHVKTPQEQYNDSLMSQRAYSHFFTKSQV